PANGGSEKVGISPLADNNHLHFNPYPNGGGPGQPKECETGNERFIPFQTVVGNVPGNAGTAHDETKRSQNLNGLEYPSATLRDLGLTSPTAKPKKPAKKKKGSSKSSAKQTG